MVCYTHERTSVKTIFFAIALISLALAAAQTRKFGMSFLAQMAQQGSIYDPAPTSREAPLTADHVLNAYWRDVKDGTQEKKAAALRNMEEVSYCIAAYEFKIDPVVRYHIAAAILAGTEFPRTPNGTRTLKIAVFNSDMALAEILLQHGAYPNDGNLQRFGYRNGDTTPPLFLAKTVEVAQLLVRHGASTDITDEGCATYTSLLHHASKQRSIALMEFYRNQKVNPLLRDARGNTCLHTWIAEVENTDDEEVLQGVDTLIAGLSPRETARLFFISNREGKTVTDMMHEADADTENDYLPYGPELIKQVDKRLIAACAAIAAESQNDDLASTVLPL